MAIKRGGRSGHVALFPKWGFNRILTAAVVILFVIGIATMPEWGKIFDRATIAVSVPKPTHVTQVKQPATKPTTPTKPVQPTKPTQPVQPTQTFSSDPVSPGEAMLGSYWKDGTLFGSPLNTPTTPAWEQSFGVIFTLPKNAQLRSPIDGVVVSVDVVGNTSPGIGIEPTPSSMNRQEGPMVQYLGSALDAKVTPGQLVAKGEVVATVSNLNASLLALGKTLNGNVLVVYNLYSAQARSWVSTFAATRVAFPYVSEPK